MATFTQPAFTVLGHSDHVASLDLPEIAGRMFNACLVVVDITATVAADDLGLALYAWSPLLQDYVLIGQSSSAVSGVGTFIFYIGAPIEITVGSVPNSRQIVAPLPSKWHLQIVQTGGAGLTYGVDIIPLSKS